MRLQIGLAGRTYELVQAETLVGRARECDLVVVEKSVSRHHAAILLSEGGARVRDLGSRNGTAVNGVLVGRDHRLHAGDRLRLGSLECVIHAVSSDDGDRDDGWLAVQATLLVKHSVAGRSRLADEVVFRIAESFEARLGLEERFGRDATDAALAAVIDYATLRHRPGWTRWAMAFHARLGIEPQTAVRRALDREPSLVEQTQELRTSGAVPASAPSPTSATSATSARRQVG